MKKATIADVAALAGVSIKTVSRVANDEPNVREATREKVQKAIDELHYRPDPSARSLSSRKSFMVGLLHDNPSASYLVNIQNGVLKASRANGYDVVIFPCDYQSDELPREIGALVRQGRVDGLILTPPLSDMDSITRLLKTTATPYVRIAPSDRSHANACVFTNDREVCAATTRYLIELGHRRIGFVIGHPDHRAVANRLLGYKDGLKSGNLPFSQALTSQGYNSFESGVDSAHKLLEGKNRPTAIFASNDDMAAGVLKVAHEMNLTIPGDLSVVGFDDVPLASLLWPSLTTIHQPIEGMARRATELLLRKLKGQATEDLPRMIESTLVVRESTGTAPQAQ